MITLLQTVANPVIDTIVKKVIVTEKPITDTLEILSKVNEFYTSAWDKLLLFGGIIGFIVPLVIQHYQKKALKISEEALEKKINDGIEKAKQEIKKDISNHVEKKIKEFKSGVDETHDFFRGLFLQFNADKLYDSKKYYDATLDYIGSIDMYKYCNDLNGVKGSLENVVDCFSKLSAEEIKKLKEGEDVDLRGTLESLETFENVIILRENIKKVKEYIK